MHQIIRLMAGSALALTFAGPALADRGTATEAMAMVKKAAAYIKTNGRDKAFSEFINPKGQFVDRDLYVLVMDMKGTMLANGANPRLVGKDVRNIKDADGRLIIQEFIATASDKGSGWVEYKWPNPATGAIERKSTFVEKHDELVIGAGIYKD
jgi:signal transduction histidine kinase